MSEKTMKELPFTRRKFLGTTAAAAAAFAINPLAYANKLSSNPARVNSQINGVNIGAITYSWRSMPSSAEEVLQYCLDCGIGTIELMGNVAEAYAGLPESPPRPERGVELTDEEQKLYQEAQDKAREAQRLWRISAPLGKYEELRNMYDDAGVGIHIVKFSPANWTDEEIDYAFNAAKILGAVGVTNEISDEACTRLGPFAEKHGMYAIFHQHMQPGEPGWTYEHFLDIHPSVMLNMDVGHYFGATGKDPALVMERLHDRIVSIHMKDKTGPDADPPNTNMPWGQGQTPLPEILKLVQERGWPIYCDIELEYPVPEGSNAVAEVEKCVDFCKNVLET